MKKELLELINNPESVLVFDIDGVLAAYEFGETNHNACSDDEWDEYVLTNNVYATARAPKIFQNLIASKNPDHIFTLSVAGDNEKTFKRDFVTSNYKIKPSNVLFVNDKMDKLDMLLSISDDLFPLLEDKKIIMIDDTVKVLTHIQDSSFFTTIHVSSFLK